MNTITITKIEEASAPNKGKAFLLAGSFSPYTVGHHEVARQAAEHAKGTGHTHFYHGIGGAAKQTHDDPLTHAQKRSIVRAGHRELAKEHKGLKFRAMGSEQRDPFRQLAHLAQRGHKHITVGLGSDQMKGKLKREIEGSIAKKGGIEDKTGKIHKVRVDFHQLGGERHEGEMPRHEVLSRLRKGDISVAKAGRLRKAVASGDTELAHELMPKHMNKPKYFGMIKSAQSKIAKPKKKVVKEGYMSFAEFVSEDIELIPVTRDRDAGKPRKAEVVHKDYGTKTYSSDKVVTRKNHGEIHPGYELHQHSVEMDNNRPSGPQRIVKHKFTIVHKASGDIAGEMHAWGGKLHPKKGVVFGSKGKALKVSHLEMHPEHGSKKVGASLPVEMYRHLHRRGHAIQSDSVQSHGGAHVWNTMRNDRELKKHMMIHDDDKVDTKQKHAFQTRAYRRPERHIWHQFSRSWSGGRDNPSKVEPEYGVDPDFKRTLILAGKKRKKKPAVVSEDIEMADILVKPKSGGLSPRNFEKMVAHKGLKPKRSGKIAKGYTLYTSVDATHPEFEDHHIVHDATGHVAGEVSTRTSGNDHTVIHTDVHGDHTQKVIGKSLAVLAYKHLAKKKGNLHSSSLQSPGGASIWNRLRKNPKMKGQVFHKMRGQAEVPAHDLPDKKIWATDVKGGMSSSNKDIPKPLPPSKHHAAEHENVIGSRLVIRPIKKTKYKSTKTGETK
jgi:hypothetical protein